MSQEITEVGTDLSTQSTAPRYRRATMLLVEWEGRELRLVACDRPRRFRVDQRLLLLLARLDDWTTPQQLTEDDFAVTVDALDALVDRAVLEVRRPDQPCDDDAATGGDYWHPADLLLQRRQDAAANGQAPHRNRPPPSAFKARPGGVATPLPPPAPLAGRLDDILRARRSGRSYGHDHMTIAALSSVLGHAVGVRSVHPQPDTGDEVFRPYAAAGARGEHELYVVANHVRGLTAGVYHYDARAHDLVRVAEPGADLQRLNTFVAAATDTAVDRPPDAVLLITAVFARVLWKYGGVGLRLIYQNTGCLYQTLYLVATALNLAPCAVGVWQELDNARWLGLNPLEESQVGCLLLGTAPSGRAR